MKTFRNGERGFTLAEAMVVIVLSGVVTIGLLGFYLNSQTIWIDGSNQAITQRDATLLIETMAEKTREAAFFNLTSIPNGVSLSDANNNEIGQFVWQCSGPGADSLVHYRKPPTPGAAPVDRGAVSTSIVEEFQLADDLVPGKVLHLTKLRLRSVDRTRVEMTSMFSVQNRP